MKERRRTFDPRNFKTIEEQYAYMDEIWPRMIEPDEEGFDLHPDDPRRRFTMTCEGVTFTKASPLTEEDLAELKRMKELMDQGGKNNPERGKAEKDINIEEK